VIARKTAVCLALSWVIWWGISDHPIGGTGEAIATHLDWTNEFAMERRR
jgi:hypothetical protein